MRLVFVNRFFMPDESATSLMLSDLVFALAEHFPDIYVITGRGHYTDSGRIASARTIIEGVTIRRVLSLPVGNGSLAGRLLNFCSFYLFGSLSALRLTRRGDVIVCLTDPPLISVLMRLIAALKGASLVNWVQDIFPETASELGFRVGSGLSGRILQRWRDRAWMRARANVVIGARMRDFLRQRGVAPWRVHVIANWARDEELTPLKREENSLRRQWGFGSGDCVVGYSGNLGRAHDVSTMLDAIELLDREEDARLRFLFIGGGARLAQARAAAEWATPGRFVFRGYQPMARLRESLAVPDIHWLSLLPSLEPLIVPSKFYGAAAAGRPIVFIGDPDGEIASLVRENGCGRAFAIGEAPALAEYLRELREDPALRAELGHNARRLAETELRRGDRHHEWLRLLRQIQTGKN